MEFFNHTVFVILYWAGWVTLAVILLGLIAFLTWLLSTGRKHAKQPRQQVDFTREDPE